MKRWTMFTMAALLLVSSLAMAQQGSKVLMIAREGKTPDLEFMLTEEVGVMTDMLKQAGFEVVVASVSGKPMTAKTKTLKPDLKLSDVKVSDYAGFIIPCLAMEVPELHPDMAAVIKEAFAKEKPIAAQTGGVVHLGQAGIMSGKKYAHSRLPVVLQDAIYSGNGVVQDGKIITSGICPYLAKHWKGVETGTSKLTEAFIAELKK